MCLLFCSISVVFIFTPQDGDRIKFSQTFDREESPLTANDDDDKDKSANKLEKMPRKMLSRGALCCAIRF